MRALAPAPKAHPDGRRDDPATAGIETLELGTREYSQVWALQRRLVLERSRGLIPDTLILVEHEPVYTLGASSRQLPPPLPFQLLRVERGGDLTYHGPGQLVGYPIVHLTERGIRVKDYLRLLEDALIEAVGGLGLTAGRVAGLTGVWARGKKIASIGIAVRSHVAYHGFALNVDVDLAPLRLINPCRLEPESISSLAELLGRPVGLEEAAPLVLAALSRRLLGAALAAAAEPALSDA